MAATNADLNETLTFVRVVEAGSFTRAGRLLDLPKSSVSRRVSRLEERLGARLLHRTTRSLRLTEVGRIYFERAARALADVVAVESEVAGMSDRPCGPLRVTTPTSFNWSGNESLIAFLKAYPEVRLELVVTNRYVDLVQEGIDVAVRGGRPPDPSLSGERIRESRVGLVASRDYLERRGRPTCLSELAGHDCLIMGRRVPTTWEFETPSGRASVSVSGPLCCDHAETLWEAARQGLGIARLPLLWCGEQNDGLEELMPHLTAQGGGMWLVYPSSRHLAPNLRAFIDWMKQWPWPKSCGG